MDINYKTIDKGATAEYEISKSRFLTFVEPIADEAAGIAFINKIKKQYFDARHNCSAYIIGHSTLQKADDDGEPSGTAGKPILEVIKKNELCDLVIVVTRYFGGIKLGAGGLIRAYGKAATLGLENCNIVIRTLFIRIRIDIDYTLLGVLENNFHKKAIFIEDKIFTDQVQLFILVKKEETDTLIQEITNWTAAACKITTLNETYKNMPN